MVLLSPVSTLVAVILTLAMIVPEGAVTEATSVASWAKARTGNPRRRTPSTSAWRLVNCWNKRPTPQKDFEERRFIRMPPHPRRFGIAVNVHGASSGEATLVKHFFQFSLTIS